MCQQYPGALPSAVLAEDGGLLMQLLEVDAIVVAAETEAAAGDTAYGYQGGPEGGESWG